MRNSGRDRETTRITPHEHNSNEKKMTKRKPKSTKKQRRAVGSYPSARTSRGGGEVHGTGRRKTIVNTTATIGPPPPLGEHSHYALPAKPGPPATLLTAERSPGSPQTKQSSVGDEGVEKPSGDRGKAKTKSVLPDCPPSFILPSPRFSPPTVALASIPFPPPPFLMRSLRGPAGQRT